MPQKLIRLTSKPQNITTEGVISQTSQSECVFSGLFDEDDLVDNSAPGKERQSPFKFSDYQTDMTLYGLDEFNNKRIEFTYTQAFPITIGSLNYNYRESGEIQSSATFVYSQLRSKLLNN